VIKSNNNRPPVAVTKEYYKGYAGKAINFNASESFDPDTGDTVKYKWDFGDGVEGGIMSVNHVYKKKGNYSVTLTVTDSEGESDSSATYAVVKEKQSEGLPGFEIILVLFAMVFIIAYKRKNKILK
jgi:PKD repeat protein